MYALFGKRRLMSDMDRSFLYRGETAEVAAEFEKRSGMSREEFFHHLASVADSGLSWDDPQLMEKVEQHYQAFVGRIPNKDFRSSIEKAHSMFDLVKRAQIVEEAAAFYKKNRWGDDSAPQQYAENEKQENTGATAPATAAASPVKSENADRSPSSLGTPVVATAKTEESTTKLSKEQMGGYLGLGGGGDELSELMTSDDADSIFRLVSKRYRKLTPALLGKAVVLEAK